MAVRYSLHRNSLKIRDCIKCKLKNNINREVENMFIHFLAKKEMRKLIPLSCMYAKYEARGNRQVAYLSIKAGSSGETAS